MRSLFLSGCALFILTLIQCAPHGAQKPPKALVVSTKIDGAVTFDSVRSIFQNRCASCHPGKGMPDWTNQATAESKRELIARRLANKTMPQIGSAEATQITNEEREKLIAWATSGGASPLPVAPDLKNLLANDKPAATKALIERCVACHGVSGTSVGPDFPNLALHDKLYITNRLKGFFQPDSKSPMNQNLTMILADFGITYDKVADAEGLFAAVAEYFNGGSLEISPAEMTARRAKLTPEQLALYENGKKIFTDNACASCHLAQEGRPMEGAPMIFGQPLNYLQKRLPELAADTNPENPMPGILNSVLETDPKALEALQIYLSNTLPSEAPPLQ